jgi:hypothetical protein
LSFQPLFLLSYQSGSFFWIISQAFSRNHLGRFFVKNESRREEKRKREENNQKMLKKEKRKRTNLVSTKMVAWNFILACCVLVIRKEFYADTHVIPSVIAFTLCKITTKIADRNLLRAILTTMGWASHSDLWRQRRSSWHHGSRSLMKSW